FGFVARAAEIGGGIRHVEIRSQAEVAALEAIPAPAADARPETSVAMSGTGITRDIGLFVTGRTWFWPTLEALHFVGLCMLFTVVVIVDFRLLGVAKSIPYSAVYQLLPIGMLGFGLNLIS